MVGWNWWVWYSVYTQTIDPDSGRCSPPFSLPPFFPFFPLSHHPRKAGGGEERKKERKKKRRKERDIVVPVLLPIVAAECCVSVAVAPAASSPSSDRKMAFPFWLVGSRMSRARYVRRFRSPGGNPDALFSGHSTVTSHPHHNHIQIHSHSHSHSTHHRSQHRSQHSHSTMILV